MVVAVEGQSLEGKKLSDLVQLERGTHEIVRGGFPSASSPATPAAASSSTAPPAAASSSTAKGPLPLLWEQGAGAVGADGAAGAGVEEEEEDTAIFRKRTRNQAAGAAAQHSTAPTEAEAAEQAAEQAAQLRERARGDAAAGCRRGMRKQRARGMEAVADGAAAFDFERVRGCGGGKQAAAGKEGGRKW